MRSLIDILHIRDERARLVDHVREGPELDEAVDDVVVAHGPRHGVVEELGARVVGDEACPGVATPGGGVARREQEAWWGICAVVREPVSETVLVRVAVEISVFDLISLLSFLLFGFIWFYKINSLTYHRKSPDYQNP